MSISRPVLRADDLDPRISIDFLKPLHKEFLKRKIPMTVAVNNAINARVGFDQAVLDYINKETPEDSWDIQLHGFEHDKIWSMTYPHVYRDVFANLYMTKRDFPRSNPTVYYPAWNETCQFLEDACSDLGLTVKTTKRTMHEFLTWSNILPEDMYFWHWWTPDDRKELPAALDKLLEVYKSYGS